MTTHLGRSTASMSSPSPSAVGRQPDRRPTFVATAAATAVAFVLLSVVVAAGLTQPLDTAAREVFRPGDVWGPTQQTFGYLVDGLAPPITATLLALGSAIAAWRAGSVRPLVFAGATAGLAVGLTLVTKPVLGRSDGHGDLHGMASSYPSGHLVMLLVVLGTLVLLFAPRSRWLWVGVGLLVLLMGVAILVVAMHWLTDLVASALLGAMVLALAHQYRNRVLGVDGEPRP